MRKPFYVKKLDAWFCWMKGTQERLTPRGGTEEEAFAKFGELSQRPTEIRPSTEVIWLFDEFLEWAKINLAGSSYDWYQNYLSSFGKSASGLTISEIRPHHVLKWANKKYGFASPSTRHGAIRSVQRAFSWALETGILMVNPIARIKKPTPNRREKIITRVQWAKILEHEKKIDWKDFFVFMRETGCRVQEGRILTAAHFDVQFSRFILPASEAKGKKRPRVIYCSDGALEIVKRRMVKYPTGPIFRNSRGRLLNSNAIRCRFRKYGDGLCATLLRHTYITEALIGGTDCVTLAALVGHADPSMVSKVYQHVSQNPEYMRDAARKITNANGGAIPSCAPATAQ